MPMPKIPYIIVSPNYRNSNAGVRVLYKLCHILNSKGYESYMTDSGSNPLWNTPTLKNDTEKTYKLINSGAIVLYPDIYPNNSFSSLRPVGFIAYPGRTLPYQNVFYYNNAMKANIPKDRILTISPIEKELFNTDVQEERNINTVWVGKGDGSVVPKDISDVKMITASEPATREELASWLKKSKVLYTCDPYTALIDESRFCGTPVVYLPNAACPNMSDFFNRIKIGASTVYGSGEGSQGYSILGIAQGNTVEDIDKARQELPEFLKFKDAYCKDEDAMVDNFIAVTQSM